MKDIKTTIGEEIEAIVYAFLSHIIYCLAGCCFISSGVMGILAFIFHRDEGISVILCIVLGIIMTIFGIRVILVQIYQMIKLRRYCSEFAKTEITVKRD